MPRFSIPCLVLKQRETEPSPTFLLFAAPASEVLEWAAIERRIDIPKGAQRKFNKAKIAAIKRFFEGDIRNTIPTAVVVTLKADAGCVADIPGAPAGCDSMKVVCFEVPDNAANADKPGVVIDGQHRLLGMAQFSPTCKVNVVAMLNVDDMEKAFQFLVINNKAEKVSSDVIRTLALDYKEDELSQRLQTARVTLHDNPRFIGIIDTDESSPFRGHIGVVSSNGNQAERFVPPSAIESSIALIQQTRVRDLEGDDAMCEFFYSIWRPIKEVWPDLWINGSRLMTKVGIISMTSYMTKALIARYDAENLDVTDPDELEKVVRQLLGRQTPNFWRNEWKSGSYDTTVGRDLVVQGLTQAARNLRAEQPWYEDVDVLSR